MLFEVLGDMWVINRNPYLQDDLINNKRRWKLLIDALYSRLDLIRGRAKDNDKVHELLENAEIAVGDFQENLKHFSDNKKHIKRALLKVTSINNIRFDALSRSSHSTDATDWRVEYPTVVITPDHEAEVSKIVLACIKLGLTIIPRGGGTGYTGGVIPLTTQSAVINTEKISFIDSINHNGNIHSVNVGAGVVTKRISELASSNNLVFAVDPTSQDACTIGGNIAMNAGGKKALRWGTTIDNLLSWKMVMPDGSWMQVRRLKHNLDKIQLEEVKVSSRVNPFIRFDQEKKLFRNALVLDKLNKSFDDAHILKNISALVEVGERVAIIGENGIGKTTLLRTLMNDVGYEPSSGEYTWSENTNIGYYAQDHEYEFETDMTLFEWMSQWRQPTDDEQAVRGYLGRLLFSADDIKKKVSVLSGGEKGRMLFGKLMMQKPNILVLDEPTNHMDMESIESLNMALEQYEGTLFFVSHDREFVSTIATRIIEITQDGYTDFAGSYDEYLASQVK